MNFNQEQHDEIIRRRHKIVVDYIKQKGWSEDYREITMKQTMEIRSLKEWKNIPENVLKEIK